MTEEQKRKIEEFLIDNQDKLKYIDLVEGDEKQKLWNMILDFLEKEHINLIEFSQAILLTDKINELQGNYKDEPKIKESLIKELNNH